MTYLSQDLRDHNKVALVNIRFHSHYWTGTACLTSPHNGDKCYLEAGQHPFVVAMKDKQGNQFTVAFYDGDAQEEEQGSLFQQQTTK